MSTTNVYLLNKHYWS